MKPIILLHGALGAKTQLEKIQHAMQEAGYTVFTVDFSGHHGVPFSSAGFGINVFAHDVLRFMNANHIGEADFFGYSMGGYVALWLAHVAPAQVGRVITLGTKFDWSVESAEREIRKMDPDKILHKLPAFARILESRHKPVDWKDLMHRTAAMMSALGQEPLLSEAIIQSIPCPTLICLGDRDDMADREYSEHVSKLLPNGKFELLLNTAHPVETVETDMLMNLVVEMLRRI